MELEVNSEAVDAGVETVEVVAGGEEGGSAALMEQQLMVANPQELIVPTSEVRLGRGTEDWRPGNGRKAHPTSSPPVQLM